MGRKPRLDENGIKRGTWSQEEDEKLRAYVLRYGHWNWCQLPKFAGLSRCGKSCRLRWLNYLRKDLKRGNYTKEEEDLILKLRDDHGNKWSLIAAKLPGRTDSEIKNYWHSCLKKSVTQISKSCDNEVTQKNIVTENANASTHDTLGCTIQKKTSTKDNNVSDVSTKSSCIELSLEFDYIILDDISLFSEENSSCFEPLRNFWTEPFQVDAVYSESSSSSISSGDFVFPYCSYYNNDLEYFDEIFAQELR